MIARGDYNLEQYLSELGQAYESFQESYGRPDTRVAVLSLMDDILAIPYTDGSGKSIDGDTRKQMFNALLTDPKWVDSHGYITLPFSTSAKALSPITRDHKILYIETSIQGPAVGDNLARLYLRQTGTGVVDSVDGDKQFYRLPPRLAVINSHVGTTQTVGTGDFDPSVYKNDHLRDRPFMNTGWELVINQRDEEVNKDINLSTLTDIQIFIYYSDFTSL
jgi:hypothetical protein